LSRNISAPLSKEQQHDMEVAW